MIYVLSIDWLSIHCHHLPPSDNKSEWIPSESDGGDMFGHYPWRYKLADYGTRQFARLHFVSIPNEEGGWDDFAEVQSKPHAHILNHASVIVRFVNRSLYRPDFWELADRFLRENDFVFKGITRIDLCADFNDFATTSPAKLIQDFAAKKLRHIGRGVGALYFNHGVFAKQYGVNYTGLSFGTHSSDVRVYLYNKSFELLTQGDKPWIRDQWVHAGLDTRNVWRLEVSIKSSGATFKDKTTDQKITIDTDRARDGDELDKIYQTFVKKLFSFVKNKDHISNITREPRITLFDGKPAYDRGCLRNISAGNRMDKMLIKALWQFGSLYRGSTPIAMQDLTTDFALALADSTDLNSWLADKINEWDKPTHK